MKLFLYILLALVIYNIEATWATAISIIVLTVLIDCCNSEVVHEHS